AVVAFNDQTREHLSRQRTEACLRLREYANSHGVHDLLHQALEEVAVLMKSPKAVWCDLEDPWYSAAVKRVPDSGGSCQWQSANAMNEAGYAELGQWFSSMPDEAVIVEPAATSGQWPATDPALQQCRFGTVREILFPLRRSGRLTAAMAVSDKARPYSARDVETVTRMGEYIWRLLEQKQMEEALLASERRYRTLYRSMMDAFVVTDLKGRIRECNDAYAALLGFSAEELKGRSVNEFTPHHWQEFEKEHLRVQLMSSGRTELYEKEYQRRDGVLVPVELRTFLLMDNEGQPEGVSAVVRDITRRRQAQEEREKLRDRLNLAQKLESVGQLAGGVAHDFNNMLGVIIGYAELALRTMDVPQPLGKYLMEIVKAGKRSADVTRQLLAFARKQTIAPKVLDLNETLGGMLKMLRRLIGEDIELLWLPGTDVWPVKMDPSQIDQLLANLCVNARDAIKGVGKITIETGKVSFDEAYCRERSGFVPGDYVVLVVSDNGSGIERDILDKIFEPFFTTKGVGQGTGLGLATVYGIVKQNNGFINVYSEPGRGTTFRIYLPRQEGNAEAGGMDDIKAVPLGRGEVVLVVEDEESMLALNRTMLDQLNYRVLTASTPAEAVRIAKEFGRTIDLLLTDVIMPEMNGRELARVICGFCPKVKTLFMSGYTANVIAHRGELDAGTHFITKPFSTEELALKVRETLQDQPAS
ncbi:MAG: PAS domain S-box protein, partial [Desulfobulbus sp.]